jgi:signal transduction histidine kinase
MTRALRPPENSASIAGPPTWEQEEGERLRARSRVLALLVAALMPAFAILDFLYTPALARTSLAIRLAVSLVSGVAAALTWRPLRGRSLVAVSMVPPLACTVGLTVLASVDGGFGSGIYSGVLLTVLSACYLLPWRAGTAALASLLAIGAYVGILLAAHQPSATLWVPVMVLAGGGVVGCVLAGLSRASREREFTLRRHLSDAIEQIRIRDAVVAHDMRNIIGAVVGLGSVLIEEATRDGDVTRADDLRVIVVANERACALLQGIVESARSSTPSLHRRHVRLFPFARDHAASWNRSLALLGIELQVVSPANEELTVDVDAGQVARALDNLLVNAREAIGQASRGVRRIRLDILEATERAGLRVSDSGGGIPPEILPGIFDRWVSTRGGGLGLATVRELVEAHGGQVEVSGTSDTG